MGRAYDRLHPPPRFRRRHGHGRAVLLLWWLGALASGPAYYGHFHRMDGLAAWPDRADRADLGRFSTMPHRACAISCWIPARDMNSKPTANLRGCRWRAGVVLTAALLGLAAAAIGTTMGNGTSIGRVRGLGSAHHGAHHWLLQRFTAVGNLVSCCSSAFRWCMLPDLEHATVTGWIADPLPALHDGAAGGHHLLARPAGDAGDGGGLRPRPRATNLRCWLVLNLPPLPGPGSACSASPGWR